MKPDTMRDLILVVVVGYLSIGFLLFLIETAVQGKFYNVILYKFLKLHYITTATMLFVGCVGAWPMIILFELLTKRKNGRKSRW